MIQWVQVTPKVATRNRRFRRGTPSKNVIAARKVIEALSKAAVFFADKFVRLYPSSITYV